METYDFYYGNQAAEFEREEIPDVIGKKGIKMNIQDTKYSLEIKSSTTKAVILNVHD